MFPSLGLKWFCSSSSQEMTLSLCQSMYLNMVVVWVCSWQIAVDNPLVELHSRSRARVSTGHSCVCELLPSFIPTAVYSPAYTLFCCTRPSECVCGESLGHVCERCLTSHRTHFDTLSLAALYVPDRWTAYSPCLCVFVERTLDTPDHCMYCMQKGPLLPSCPHSFFTSSKPAWSRLFVGCLLEQVSSPPDERVVLFILTGSLEWMFLKTRQEKQCIAGSCQGMHAGSFCSSYPLCALCER